MHASLTPELGPDLFASSSAAVGGLSRDARLLHDTAPPGSGAHATPHAGAGGRVGPGARRAPGAQDPSASARPAAVAVTVGAGEGAELALLTAALKPGGRKLGRGGGGEVGVAPGGGSARAGFGGAWGPGHVTGRRPRYRLAAGVTSPPLAAGGGTSAPSPIAAALAP